MAQTSTTAPIKFKPSKIKTSLGSKIFDICNYSFIFLFCFSILFPLWDTIVVSLSDASVVSTLSINFWPKVFTLDSYKFALSDETVWVAFRNSILRTVIATVYHLVVCCLAACAMTRKKMPGRWIFTVIFLIPMYFGGGTIPTYLNLKDLGLLDNFLVYILPAGFSMYNTIIIRNYFFSIDKSLEEAAAIDGATPLQTLFKITIPLSKPVLATVGMWQMVGQWNAWYDNMVYCRRENLMTLQFLLKRMVNEIQQMTSEINQQADLLGFRPQFTSETVIAATTVIVIVPIICVYPFLQKYFVKGVMLGAVKG